MESKETNTLLVLYIIGLLLLGDVCTAASKYDFSSNADLTYSDYLKHIAGPEAETKNFVALIRDGCSQSMGTLTSGFSGKPLELGYGGWEGST